MSTRLDVQGVVAISTPNYLPRDHPLWLIRFVAMFRPLHSKSNGPPGTGWFDREAWQGHISYPRNPARSAGELKLLLAEMRAALSKVNVPVLLIHSRDDTYVLPENMNRIHAALGARDKEMLWVTGSGHVVTRDAARAQAYEAVAKFLRRTGASA
jgi:esterase/lipase